MTDNASTVVMGTTVSGAISNNCGVVLGDASGHVHVIGGSCDVNVPFYTNVDRLANKQLLPPRQVARSITIRPGPDKERNKVSEVPQNFTIPRSKRTKPRSGPRDM